MTIFRAQEKKQLQRGLNAVVGLEYNDWEKAWPDIFTEERSEKAYEEEVMMAGTGAAQVKDEGDGVHYDDMYETFTSRYMHSTVAIAVSITEEAVEDNLYEFTPPGRSSHLAIPGPYSPMFTPPMFLHADCAD